MPGVRESLPLYRQKFGATNLLTRACPEHEDYLAQSGRRNGSIRICQSAACDAKGLFNNRAHTAKNRPAALVYNPLRNRIDLMFESLMLSKTCNGGWKTAVKRSRPTDPTGDRTFTNAGCSASSKDSASAAYAPISAAPKTTETPSTSRWLIHLYWVSNIAMMP